MTNWNKCLSLIPKGTQTASKSFQHISGIEPFFVEKGDGPYFYTNKKEKILDYCCGLGPVILGYNNKNVNRAIKKQLSKGILFSAPIELELQLAQKINKIIPNAEMVRFAKNGSDAVLIAVRIALAYTGKKHIATFGYHGFNDFSAVSLMPKGIPYWNEYVHEFEYNNLESLENILKNYDCACILMEPISLEMPNPSYLKNVRKLAMKYNTLLIFDEIVSGFRYKLGGCQEKYGVYADLVCLGKAMGNGMPISCVCGEKKYMSLLENEVMFSLTFGAEALSLSAGLATIDELEKKKYNHIHKLGYSLMNGIIDSAYAYNLKIDLRGNPYRMYLDFSKDYPNHIGIKSIFNQKMFENGIFMPNVIYVNFAHRMKHIEKTKKKVDEVFKFISNNLENIPQESEKLFIKRKQ